MTTRHLAVPAALLAPREAKNLLEDGTLWSHAATLGTRVRDDIGTFTIDADKLRAFVANASRETKIPVDYDHGTTSGAADGTVPVPKAGDVLELAAVLSPDDLNPSMRAQIEAAGRKLDDPRNLGLWVRWRPTRRALGMVLEGEYSEMSIAWHDDYPDNTTGERLGPTLLAVALTNTPFLQDMIPVAASRRDGGTPAESGTGDTSMSKPTILARLSAALGRALPSDEDAADAAAQRITELQRETVELAALKPHVTALTSELGVADLAAALPKVKELKADAQAARDATKAAQATALSAQVDTILKAHEDKFVPAEKDFLSASLKRELTAGTKAGETETEKALTARPKHGLTTQHSGGDDGKGGNLSKDKQIKLRAEALMTEDAAIKELARTNRQEALKAATLKAAQELGQ